MHMHNTLSCFNFSFTKSDNAEDKNFRGRGKDNRADLLRFFVDLL